MASLGLTMTYIAWCDRAAVRLPHVASHPLMTLCHHCCTTTTTTSSVTVTTTRTLYEHTTRSPLHGARRPWHVSSLTAPGIIPVRSVRTGCVLSTGRTDQTRRPCTSLLYVLKPFTQTPPSSPPSLKPKLPTREKKGPLTRHFSCLNPVTRKRRGMGMVPCCLSLFRWDDDGGCYVPPMAGTQSVLE